LDRQQLASRLSSDNLSVSLLPRICSRQSALILGIATGRSMI
jgi:hypothetical protein